MSSSSFATGARARRPRLSRGAAFAGTAYAFAATMVGTTLPTPLYSLYQQKFGFSELMITVIFATYAAGVICALVLLGGLSDEIGRRPMLLVGLGFSVLSAIAFLLADGLGLLLVGRVLSGLSAGVFTGTATATIVDLAPPDGTKRATLVATMANMGGLGCGPLLAGLLAQWVAAPLRTPFWVDLGLLVPAVILVLAMPEPTDVKREPRVRPRKLAVPADIRGIFVRASLAGFAGFAVLGLMTAVTPAFLGHTLGVSSDAVVGLVVFVAFASSTAGQAMLERVSTRVALPAGCALLIAGMALLALALAISSLALLIAGIVVAGVGQGLSFRAGLAALNSAAPPEHRGGVASSFFVVAYLAISGPVIGVGVLAEVANLRAAGLIFAGVVSIVSAIALVLLARGTEGGT
jgi:MFS family permease